jgi:hypothetical protein
MYLPSESKNAWNLIISLQSIINKWLTARTYKLLFRAAFANPNVVLLCEAHVPKSEFF